MKASGTESIKTVSDHDALTERATAWLVRLQSDRLTEDDRRTFNEWLDRDSAHRAAYDQAQALWGELGGLPDPRSAAGETTHAPVTPAPPAIRGRPRRHRYQQRYAAVAACLLVLIIGLWTVDGYDALRADYATAVGEMRTVTLADGSTVQLNTDTALAVDFSDRRRRIEIFKGEAFFEVVADRARPFEVAAGEGVSRALGTRFNVRRGEGAVIVAVAEGRVRVTHALAAQASDEGLTLGQGEAARYTTRGAMTKSNVDVAPLTAWRKGKLVFANRPLHEVIHELDRYRPGIIRLLDSDLAEQRFTGVVSLHDTDRALAAIEKTLAVDIVRITPYLTLLRSE